MANDFISRDYAVENMENYPWDTEHDKNAAIHLVRELVPAADVRPVVRAEWIVSDHGDYQLIECDQCHAQMWNHQSELPNYCYECGFDMRKVVEIDQVKEDKQ